MKALCLTLVCVAIAAAQSGTGELRITVKDQTGAPVAAEAEIVNLATHTRQSVDIPPEGRYSFRSLPPGTYRVNISRTGFAPNAQLLEIRSALPLEHSVTLTVDAMATAVEVKESETLLDPARTAAAYYVGSQEIKERKTGLSGRSLVDLVVMQPGWTLEANGVLHPRESEYETQYIVNGFPVQDNRSPAFAPSVDVDDVQSMKVYTSGIPAEYGQKTGGVIELNTSRNTSPGFHGTAVLQEGSFDTLGGYVSGQYVSGKTTSTVTAEGFLTSRFLDPPVLANYTNHASNSSFSGTAERDLNDANRFRISLSRRATHFLVPDELLQQAAGQREDRQTQETGAQVAYQHVFSPSILGGDSRFGARRSFGFLVQSARDTDRAAAEPRVSRRLRGSQSGGALRAERMEGRRRLPLRVAE